MTTEAVEEPAPHHRYEAALAAARGTRLNPLLLRAALAHLSGYGWVPFGTHARDNPFSDCPELEFSAELDEDGRPRFERAVAPG